MRGTLVHQPPAFLSIGALRRVLTTFEPTQKAAFGKAFECQWSRIGRRRRIKSSLHCQRNRRRRPVPSRHISDRAGAAHLLCACVIEQISTRSARSMDRYDDHRRNRFRIRVVWQRISPRTRRPSVRHQQARTTRRKGQQGASRQYPPS